MAPSTCGAGIKHSCDVYFYDVARTHRHRYASPAWRGASASASPRASTCRARSPGSSPTRAWKKATLKDSWHPGETLIAGIGQGFIQTTPLQLAVMTARLANGGYALKPRTGAAGQADRSLAVPIRPRSCSPAWASKPEHLKLVWRRDAHGGERAPTAPPMAPASASPAWRWPARPAAPRSAASPWPSA